MNCVLFAKMDQVFSLKKQNIKKYRNNGKRYWKSYGKVREFCQSGKVGTLTLSKLQVDGTNIDVSKKDRQSLRDQL